MNASGTAFDYDWLVIGSGFGGSVAALRLAEKGYRVGVLEAGRRYADDDFAESSWDARRLIWAPFLGLRGPLRISVFREVVAMSGVGVGGGSLVYANVMLRARPEVYDHPQWSGLDDWESSLAPFYDTAERMLGATDYDEDGPADLLLKEYAESVGRGDTFRRIPVAVYLGTPGQTVPDPYFDGEGPERAGCTKCGNCMLGCRVGAKNTLVKNYLWLAERQGVQVLPERTVLDVRPLGAADGADGYKVTSERTGRVLKRERQSVTARGVIFAGGALGTTRLLAACKTNSSLPRLSDRVGELVRTNSESGVAVTAPDDSRDFSRSVSISAVIAPTADTVVETTTFGPRAGAYRMLFAPIVTRGTRRTRPLYLVREVLKMARLSRPTTVRRKSLIAVMQLADNALELQVRRRLPGGRVQLKAVQDQQRPIPDRIEQAHIVGGWLAQRLGGRASVFVGEAVTGTPLTAHLMGGAVIGADPTVGVVDAQQRVFGYSNMLVCDGAVVPTNLGVNPSLTITALAERAISTIPTRDGAAG